jgi:hypothetical protein
MLDTAYVGSLARHLQDNRNLNPVPYGAMFLPENQDPQKVATTPNVLLGNNALPADFLRQYRGYGQINLYESNSTSNYNALQVNLTRRFSNNASRSESPTRGAKRSRLLLPTRRLFVRIILPTLQTTVRLTSTGVRSSQPITSTRSRLCCPPAGPAGPSQAAGRSQV